MYFLLRKNYLDINTIRMLTDDENVDDAMEDDMSGLESADSTTSGSSLYESSAPPCLSEVSKFVSTAGEVCRGLNHIEDLKVHTFVEILFHCNPISVLPIVSWNIRMWNDVHDVFDVNALLGEEQIQP
ncbi:hypothetical protein RFI_21344 [Reticulomyxa filosa]|uniref:Uncharacterized protein n=1 Tax=Reticulomyxa filosa TaxID=46433 RepID=X6MQU0_RETFI|nr:hypothetical protein RFI_21344 [Reticulomyxa filosa]|eukprot:ETO16016.1 hypothetical protein RFI_21344 [Reticulomyxa filosa]